MYAAFLIIASNVFSWVIDDLYIYFRYANNFVSGKGIVYNAGEYVEGFSSFSWLLILSLIKLVNLPLELSSKLTGLFFAFINLILLYKICRSQKLGRLSFLACSLMLFNLPFVLWSISGFENMFYIFLLLFSFYKIVTQDFTSNGIVIISVFIFLISISRPEGIMFSVIFLFFVYAFSGSKTILMKTAFIFTLLFCSFLVFRYYYFDDIFPNTYYAKIGHNIIGSYELKSYKNGILYILDFYKHNPQFLLFLFFIPFAYDLLKHNKVIILSLTIIAGQFVFIIFSGGDWMVQYRFAVVAIPFLSLSSAISLDESFKLFSSKLRVPQISVIIILIIIASSLIFADYKIIVKETILWNNLKVLSGEIKNLIPSNSLIANGSSGIIPYYIPDVTFLDIVGLTNKHIAKNGVRRGTWFEKTLPQYVYDMNPAWLILWKKKDVNGIYSFENASPCYFDMAQNENFRKYSLEKTYDVYEDIRVELYKVNNTDN